MATSQRTETTMLRNSPYEPSILAWWSAYVTDRDVMEARKVVLQRWLKAREKVPAYADNVREIRKELAKIEEGLAQ